MKNMNIEEAANFLEELARHDPKNRGLSAYCKDRTLFAAAKSLFAGERIILITGFLIKAAMAGDTDGPPGTLALARALKRLGKEVTIVTDPINEPLVREGASALGESFSVEVMHGEQQSIDQAIDHLIHHFAPTHIVAIERPGSALDGHLYSMRGEAIDELIPKFDRFLDKRSYPVESNITTLAIGDGGNELGMGSLREAAMTNIHLGELIFCATPADIVIPAGISNWGGHALSAMLSILAAKDLMITPGEEKAMISKLLELGAVDGYSKESTLSVDGVAWEDYAQQIEAMRDQLVLYTR